MKTYLLSISSPDGTVFREEVQNLVARGVGGDLAIMAGHTPFVTSLKPCTIKIELPDNTTKTAKVDGGLLTVTKEGARILTGSYR